VKNFFRKIDFSDFWDFITINLVIYAIITLILSIPHILQMVPIK
jgi:hypothetical protein